MPKTTKTTTTKTKTPETTITASPITRKQALSGKGKARVQIAQEAVERLESKLRAAKARLAEARAAEEARAAKSKEQVLPNLLKAAKALRAAGNIAMAEQLEAEAEAFEASQAAEASQAKT